MRYAGLFGMVASIAALAGCTSGSGDAQASTSTSSASAVQSASRPAVPTGSAAAPSASASSPAPIAVPVPADKVLAVLNPKGEEPYSGPVGKLTGIITIRGDKPPATDVNIPPKCPAAGAMYDKLFRVGRDRALADAMVSVTEYHGFVPDKHEAVKLSIDGCAFSRRTLVVTFGQRIEVSNKDRTQGFMPYLDGAPYAAVMVAVPGGEPVKLYAQEPGHYMVRDMMKHLFMQTDVFTLKYATHDVTDLDGRYQIDGIPVGKVRVDTFLPAIKKSTGKSIEIHEGDNSLDLELTFDAKKDLQDPKKDAPKADAPKPPQDGSKTPPK